MMKRWGELNLEEPKYWRWGIGQMEVRLRTWRNLVWVHFPTPKGILEQNSVCQKRLLIPSVLRGVSKRLQSLLLVKGQVWFPSMFLALLQRTLRKEEPLTISLSLVPYWNISVWIPVIVAICIASQLEKNLSLLLAYCEQKTLQTFGVSLQMWWVIRVFPSL